MSTRPDARAYILAEAKKRILTLDGAWGTQLQQAGLTEADFRWPTGARSIYFRDPAGNSLECAEPGLWSIE